MNMNFDGLRNLIANLGTSRDKASHGHWVEEIPSDAQLSAMYRSSGVARKIVDIVALDACREWREWMGDEADVGTVEALEGELGVQKKVMDALTKARLYGGSAIYIGTGEVNAARPLNPSTLKQGGLRYLAVIPRSQIATGSIERDPREPLYGKPTSYNINGQEIHPTRLAVFEGLPIIDDNIATSFNGWGDSVLTPLIEPIRNLEATLANIASLVYEAKIDVLGIKNFNQDLRDHGADFEKVALAKLSLTAAGKGINGMFLKDAEDTYDQKTASFANLPNIVDRFMQAVAGPSDIPVTRLFGMSPGGLNATGESDTRNYYDGVKAMQTIKVSEAMGVLDECLRRSALGERADDVYYEWRPLWQASQKEKADSGKTIAEAHRILFDMEVNPDAVGRSLVAALEECGIASGVTDALEREAQEEDEL